MPAKTPLIIALFPIAAWGLLHALSFHTSLYPLLADAARTGILPDGTVLRTTYTHVPFLDYPATFGIAFFHTFSRDAVHRLFTLNMFHQLTALYMLFLAESLRPSSTYGTPRRYLQKLVLLSISVRV